MLSRYAKLFRFEIKSKSIMVRRVWWVLGAGASREVRSRIRAPITDDAEDLGLPLTLCHLMLTSKEECIYLGYDLRGCEVLHPDSATWTESSACSTSFALRLRDLHDLPAVLLDERERLIWAEVYAHSTAGALLLNALSEVRLQLDLSQVDRDTGS